MSGKDSRRFLPGADAVWLRHCRYHFHCQLPSTAAASAAGGERPRRGVLGDGPKCMSEQSGSLHWYTEARLALKLTMC